MKTNDLWHIAPRYAVDVRCALGFRAARPPELDADTLREFIGK